jgi:hypothetical protein
MSCAFVSVHARVLIFADGGLKNTLELRKSQHRKAQVRSESVTQAWHEVVNALVTYRLEQPSILGSAVVI